MTRPATLTAGAQAFTLYLDAVLVAVVAIQSESSCWWIGDETVGTAM